MDVDTALAYWFYLFSTLLSRLRHLCRCTRGPRRSTWGIYRFTLDFSKFLREIEIRGNAAGDQPCTAAECQILYRPLNENENAALKRNQIGYMDKSPNEPR